MVPHLENRTLFTCRLRRYGRLLLSLMLLVTGYVGYGQSSPPPYTLQITVTTNNSVDDGTALDVVLVTVLDASNNPVSGVDVAFSINGGSSTTVNVTNAAGQVTFAQGNTNTSALTVDINAKYLGITVASGNCVFLYVQGPPSLNPPPGSPNPSYFVVTGNDAAANGTDTNGIQVHVADAQGVNYPVGTPVTFTITSATPASGSMIFYMGPYTLTYHATLGQGGMVDLPLYDV
ncbi:MAG TPA: Ig-like domain-containing protein, partial [Puia sp.]|nr:Ig-like domain-containing protein [Puia sp.]